MRNLKGLAVVALMLVLSIFESTSAYSQRKPLDEALKRLDDNYKGLTTLRAKVTMDKYVSQTGDHDISEGSIMLLPLKGRDPAFRVDWTKPANESLSVFDGKYTIWRSSQKQAIQGSISKAKNSAAAGNAFAFMNMSKAQLKEDYELSYVALEKVSGGTLAWHIQLVPRTAMRYKIADVWIDADGFPVQARFVEKNNDSTTVLLTGPKKNAVIKVKDIEIRLPSGIERIKG
ncbi:MAG: outer membrane lipoprotein carrier protein LolA [Acidobacteriota bacterium]